MYSEFRSFLERAKGQSELVMVANADIRGFSKFSLEQESVEAALFVKKVYMALLSDYFDYVDFYKPTGDGLLMVFEVEEDTLVEQANRLVKDSLRLVDDFAGLLSDDPIINFRVPNSIGIGLARGAASRLVSADRTLDYSGKVLNLASRLMDIARPAGVVLDESFGFRLLDEAHRSAFTQDSIYVRSVAERQPINVYYTHEHTRIPAAARRRIDVPEWHEETVTYTAAEIEEMDGTSFYFPLEQRTVDPDSIKFLAWHPSVMSDGKLHPTVVHSARVAFRYVEDAGKPILKWNTRELTEKLHARGVAGEADVRLIVNYPI